MDINRLIRIANHFDKIGAYTISDEFEEKFIRTAAPADTVRTRSKKVTDLVGKDQNLITEAQNIASRILGDYFNNQADVFAKYQYSLNTFKAWKSVIQNYYTDTLRTNTKKANEILKIAFDLNDAFNKLQTTTPRGATSVNTNSNLFQDIYADRERYSGNDIELLKALSRDISYEITTWSSDSTKLAYLSHLRDAEDRLADLATPPAATPAAAKPAPSTPAQSTPAAAKPPTPPSGPSPNQGGGSAKPSTKPTSTKQTSTKPGRSKEDDAGLALSNIVRREYSKAHPEVEDRDILLNMRLVGSFTLKTYYDITKEPSLNGSIRAAIKASPYSQYFKETMLKIYENKLKAAKEKNEGPTIITPATQPNPPKDEPKKDESKKEDDIDPKKYKFQCSREGLFIEIKRMDTLSENDPNKYMVDYFPDIKQVIDCHSRLREKIEHKDNIQLDVLINILESKYFSLINKTQFPY